MGFSPLDFQHIKKSFQYSPVQSGNENLEDVSDTVLLKLSLVRELASKMKFLLYISVTLPSLHLLLSPFHSILTIIAFLWS